MAAIPESAEVAEEAAVRQAWIAKLWVLWQADPQTDGYDFTSPNDLRGWVVRRLLAAAGSNRRGDEDEDTPTIAEGVSRILGRHAADQFGFG